MSKRQSKVVSAKPHQEPQKPPEPEKKELKKATRKARVIRLPPALDAELDKAAYARGMAANSFICMAVYKELHPEG